MENGIKREVYLGTKKKKKTQLSHTQSFHDIHYPQRVHIHKDFKTFTVWDGHRPTS